MAPLPGGYHLDYRVVLTIRTFLVAYGVLLLAMHPGQFAPDSGRRRRLERSLMWVALLGILSWPNFGAFHGPNHPVALHDVFHYYVGAKYFPELGYTRMYQCVATAEMDAGRGIDVARRWHRDLETNELTMQAPTLSEQAECRSRFGGRWDLFRRDVEWFRAHMAPNQWLLVHTDHGFNATPTWAATAHWLIGGAPVSAAQVLSLSALDYVLLGAMCVIIWRTFGGVVCAIAALWWALSELTDFRWLGGAFLRHDALFCIVAATCALKSGRSRAAGLLLSAAVLLRAYPLAVVACLAVHLLWRVWQSGLKGFDSSCRALLLGFVAGSIALIALTEITWAPRIGPMEPWRDFVTKAENHVDTAQFTNNLGLRTVLSYSQASRVVNVRNYGLDGPDDAWNLAQTSVFESRKWMYWLAVTAFLVLLVVALRRTDDWIAVILGIAVLPIVANLSNYYYSVLLVFAFLWPRDRVIGIGLASLSLLTDVLWVLVKMRDDSSFVTSVALILLCVLVTYRVGFGTGFQPRLRDASQAAVPQTAGP